MSSLTQLAIFIISLKYCNKSVCWTMTPPLTELTITELTPTEMIPTVLTLHRVDVLPPLVSRGEVTVLINATFCVELLQSTDLYFKMFAQGCGWSGYIMLNKSGPVCAPRISHTTFCVEVLQSTDWYFKMCEQGCGWSVLK